MKRLLILVFHFCTFIFLGAAYAEGEGNNAHLEDTQMIINVTPGTSGTSGVILALPCPECQSRRFSFDRNTRFYLNGAAIELKTVGQKIDWRGMINFSPRDPDHALEVFLSQPESRK